MNTINANVTDLHAARNAATLRYLKAAEAIKAEAGIQEHIVRKSLTGRAYKGGKIQAPEGRTRKQLYILAHECAHVALNHFYRKKTRHLEEMEAEKWAHAALRRHGVAVPRSMTKGAKEYVAHKINQALRRGAKTINSEARAYAGSGAA